LPVYKNAVPLVSLFESEISLKRIDEKLEQRECFTRTSHLSGKFFSLSSPKIWYNSKVYQAKGESHGFTKF
jgi:hypothetical protein